MLPLSFFINLYGQSRLVIYHYPIDNSKYNNPSTNILFTFKDKLNEEFRGNFLLVVSNEKNEIVSGKLNYLSNGRTIIFNPDHQFANSAKINVKLYINKIKKKLLEEFTFIISKETVPIPEADKIADEINRDLFSTVNEPGDKLSKIHSDSIPFNFPAIEVTINTTPSTGKIFCSNISPLSSNVPYLMILDSYGKPIFYRKMNGNCTDFKVQNNGMLTYFTTSTRKFYAMDSSYAVTDSFYCGNGYQTDPHELLLLPNGNAILLGLDPQVVDMSKIVPGAKTDAIVIGVILQEIDPSKNVVFQWRTWDYFNITDAEHIDLTEQTIDYVHSNAIELDNDGNILLSSRHLSEITKIDRQTGKIIWRLGGKNNQFIFINDPIGFSYQHAIRRTNSGTYTLFDNGNFHSPPFSRGVEYKIDDKSKTSTLVWEYRNDPVSFSPALGYVDRLENGNTTISWGMSDYTFSEINPIGAKVYEFNFDSGIYSYRVVKQKWQDNIIQNESPAKSTMYQNFPNPFNSSTTITIDLTQSSVLSLKIFNVLGKEVAKIIDNKLIASGINTFTFNAIGYSSGVYFYQFKINNESYTRKMVLLK